MDRRVYLESITLGTGLTAASAVAAGGRFERFKTSQFFDSTAKHPQWLG